MKAKKAVKKIAKIESMLALVLEACPRLAVGPRQLLDDARKLAVQARTDMAQTSAKQPSKDVKTADVKTAKATPRKSPGRSAAQAAPLAEAG